jgi:hypothetical protein
VNQANISGDGVGVISAEQGSVGVAGSVGGGITRVTWGERQPEEWRWSDQEDGAGGSAGSFVERAGSLRPRKPPFVVSGAVALL